MNVFFICFNGFESGGVDGEEGGEFFFSFFTQIKRFVGIHVEF